MDLWERGGEVPLRHSTKYPCQTRITLGKKSSISESIGQSYTNVLKPTDRRLKPLSPMMTPHRPVRMITWSACGGSFDLEALDRLSD